MFIPAYAQNTTIIEEPVIVEESQNISNELFNLIIISVIASVIGSFVGGSVLGFFFSNKIENDRNNKDLQKLHSLIKSDFSSISRFVNRSESTLKSYQEVFEKGNYSEQIISELSQMTVENHDPKMYGKFVNDVKLILVFSYKNTIELNGLLIKLEPDEIKIIQVVFNSVVSHDELIQKNWESMIDKLPQFKVGMKMEDKIKQVNLHALDYMKQGLSTIESIKEVLENTKTIDWMDLESEITLPKIESHLKSLKKKS